jgi:hypothetical protein
MQLGQSEEKCHHPRPQERGGGWSVAASVGRIYKERGKRWFIQLPGRIRIYADKNGRSFYSEEQAMWTLAQIQGEIENGTYDGTFYSNRKKSVHSFEVYALGWLQNCERRLQRKELSPTCMREVRRYVHTYFIPTFGPMHMADIRGLHIKTFYLGMENLSAKTMANIMNVLKKMFRDAVDEEVIQILPKFPKLGDPPEPETVWADEEQQDAIFQHLDPSTFFFVYFLATHGVRPGEASVVYP